MGCKRFSKINHFVSRPVKPLGGLGFSRHSTNNLNIKNLNYN